MRSTSTRLLARSSTPCGAAANLQTQHQFGVAGRTKDSTQCLRRKSRSDFRVGAARYGRPTDGTRKFAPRAIQPPRRVRRKGLGWHGQTSRASSSLFGLAVSARQHAPFGPTAKPSLAVGCGLLGRGRQRGAHSMNTAKLALGDACRLAWPCHPKPASGLASKSAQVEARAPNMLNPLRNRQLTDELVGT